MKGHRREEDAEAAAASGKPEMDCVVEPEDLSILINVSQSKSFDRSQTGNLSLSFETNLLCHTTLWTQVFSTCDPFHRVLSHWPRRPFHPAVYGRTATQQPTLDVSSDWRKPLIGLRTVAASPSWALIGGRTCPSRYIRVLPVRLDLALLPFLSAVGRSRCPLSSHVPLRIKNIFVSCFRFDAPFINSLQPLKRRSLACVHLLCGCSCVFRAHYFDVWRLGTWPW